MKVLDLGGEEADHGKNVVFLVYDRDRVNGWQRRRPSGGAWKKCKPCAANGVAGLQSTFLASQSLLVRVPVRVDIKQAINDSNLVK